MCTSRRHDLNLEFAGGLGQDVLPNRRVSNAPTDRLAVFPAERFAEYRCMCPEDRETECSQILFDISMSFWSLQPAHW